MRYQYTPNVPRVMTNSPYEAGDAKKVTHTTIASNVKFRVKENNNCLNFFVVQVTFSDLVIHVVAISESVRLQQVLATYGIQTQTPKQVEPILICPPSELVKVNSIEFRVGSKCNRFLLHLVGIRQSGSE